MLKTIRGSKVVGSISGEGKCPHCKKVMVVRDYEYTFIKNKGTIEFDDGSKYVKCNCGYFVMLKGADS